MIAKQLAHLIVNTFILTVCLMGVWIMFCDWVSDRFKEFMEQKRKIWRTK